MERWSHWPVAVIVAAIAFSLVAYLTRSLAFGTVVGALLGFLTHGETRRLLRRRFRTPRPPRPWLASPAIRRRAIVSLGLLAAIVWWGIGSATGGLSPENARSIVQGWGAWGPLLLIGLSGFSMLLAPVPNGPFAIAAGVLWGTWLGTLYALLGQLLGATLGFYAARFLGRRYLPRLVGQTTAGNIDQLSMSMGPHLVFWTRMAPFIPIDFTAYAAGLTAMRYRIFISAFMVGAILPTWIIVWVGDTLHESWTARIISFSVVVIALILITALYAYFNRGTIPPRRRWREWVAWKDAFVTPPVPAPPTPEEEPATPSQPPAS